MVVAEERPRIALASSFARLFSGLNLSPRAVSTSFGCRVNVAMCLQVGGEKIELIIHFFSHKDKTFFCSSSSVAGREQPRPDHRLRGPAGAEERQGESPPTKMDELNRIDIFLVNLNPFSTCRLP